MGASRARLTQQLLTESVFLALAGTVAGLLFAVWTISIASQLQPAPLASQSYSILDSRVLTFAVVAAFLSALLFGALPSLYAARVPAFGSRASTDTRASRRAREALVAGQVSLTIVLVAASISVGRALVHLMRLDRGFDTTGVVTVSLEGTSHQNAGSRLAYFQQALARVRRAPGIQSASATEFLPLYATAFLGAPFQMDGHPAKDNTSIIPIFSDYFRTMGGRILWGREFTDAENQGNAKVAIVNERFAAEFGAPANALGREITSGTNGRWRIVGIVKGIDFMADGKTTGENSNQVFLPSQSPGGFFSTFVVRVKGRAQDRLPMIGAVVETVDPQVPVFGVKTMDQRLADVLARPRFYRTAVICFAAFGLLLAVIGIYGIVSYAVAQQTREMGIRMALGTTPPRVRASLLRQGLTPIAAGAVVRIVGAMVSGRLLSNLVDGAKAVEPITYAASVFFIACIAATATWVATNPITRLNVMEILRTEK